MALHSGGFRLGIREVQSSRVWVCKTGRRRSLQSTGFVVPPQVRSNQAKPENLSSSRRLEQRERGAGLSYAGCFVGGSGGWLRDLVVSGSG